MEANMAYFEVDCGNPVEINLLFGCRRWASLWEYCAFDLNEIILRAMAASGIAEHDEARRRERVYLQKAYLVREMEEARKNLNRQILLEQATYPRKYIGAPQTSTYDAEVQRMKTLGLIGGNDPKSQDRARRLAHYEQMKTEYSAKLPNRYSSTDYKSQW